MEWHIIATIGLSIAATLNLVIGSIVLARNSQKRLNKYFFGLTFAITGWTVTNILFGISVGDIRFAIALLSYGFGGLSGVFFGLFCLEYLSYETGKTLLKSTQLKVVAAWGVGVSLVSVGPQVVGRAVTDDGEIVTNLPTLVIYGVTLLLNVAIGLIALFVAKKGAPISSRQRTNSILFGLAFTAGVGIFFNLVLPLQGIYNFVALGPLGSIALVAMCGYAIARHKLFDIRLVIARTLGYLLSIMFVGAAYGLIAFGITDRFILEEGGLTRSQQIVFTVLAVVIGFTLPSLKRFFDKLTNSIFYRDAYDPRTFIDQLNRKLVSYADLKDLLMESSVLIRDTFKSEYCVFAVPSPEDNKKPLFAGSDNVTFSGNDITFGQEAVSKIRANIVAADELGMEHNKLKVAMESRNIALLVRVAPNHQQHNESYGYIIVGNKRSGNVYTRQDLEMFEIVANSMVIALQNAYRFEEIKRFNITLQEKIDNATRQLRKKNERLRLLDQTKDDFISMASHQLRTPLTSVKGYVSMVLEGDAGKVNDLQRKLLNQSFVSAQRMVYLISDLLNVSRLKTGKFELEPMPTNLAKVISSEIDQLQETAKARKLELTYHKPDHFPTYMLDETKLRQVVMNFVDNAIYYTHSGGRIEVHLEDKQHALELTVIDNGIGVPKRDQPQLFTKYFRARNAQTARPDGTGLGLFMAKKVIIAHGGAVIFKSQENKGSTFGFSLPKSALKTPPKPTEKISTIGAEHTTDKSAQTARQ